jgi:ribonuclease HI
MTLAKSVLEAIPLYPMMTSIIPKTCVEEIQRKQRRFIWGDTENSRRHHAVGWDTMTKPKEFGGLGLRRLDIMNQACILKLGSKLQSDSSDFWCKVLWGKYRRENSENIVIAKPSDSHLWKSIVKLWPKLNKFCFWSIRDGRSVDWYTDAWIEEGLRVNELNLHVPENWTNMKVADLVDANGDWRQELLAEWLPSRILNKIQSIPPPDDGAGADVRYCLEDAHGNFSISAMYHVLCNFEEDEAAMVWNKIWKLQVPERVRVFVWMMHHDRLLTNHRKSRMGLGSAMCSYCGDQCETILHVLRDCPLVMPLWLNMVRMDMRGQFFAGNILQWIHFNLSNNVGVQQDMKWPNVWAVACHFAWGWRNKEKHDEHYVRPTTPTMFVMRNVHSYMLAEQALQTSRKTLRIEILINWKTPPVGWVKLNTDGSCGADGCIGCGGIIRGSDGEWLEGFAKYVGHGTAYLAELWGVYEGLQVARRMNFHRVELHVDSMVVVQVLNSNGRGSLRGRALVEKIRRLLSLDWEIVVHHSYREANQCADALANYGCNINVGSVFFDVCPSALSHLLLADVLGITTPRLIPL